MTSKITVMVTGVGAIIGQGIIKSLRRSSYAIRVVGIDRSAKSIGPSMCDVFAVKPNCDESHPTYLSYLRGVIENEDIDLILPGLEVDMHFFDQHRHFIDSQRIPIALNTAKLIAATSDKYHFGELLRSFGLPHIPTLIAKSWSEAIDSLGEPPFILKPRQGNGSRGLVRLNDKIDFDYWTKKSDDGWMLQRIVGTDDEEYTVGLFGLGDGKYVDPIIFRRRLSNTGNTLEAQTVHDEIIKNATKRVTQIFQPLGPTNYQFRKENNLAYLLEINPRFSSSNSIRSAFGYNEAEMAVEYFCLNKTPKIPRIIKGIGWRYMEDYIEYDSNFV